VRRKDEEKKMKEIGKRYRSTRSETRQKMCVTHACSVEVSSDKWSQRNYTNAQYMYCAIFIVCRRKWFVSNGNWPERYMNRGLWGFLYKQVLLCNHSTYSQTDIMSLVQEDSIKVFEVISYLKLVIFKLMYKIYGHTRENAFKYTKQLSS
jgi:hypothetical protein